MSGMTGLLLPAFLCIFVVCTYGFQYIGMNYGCPTWKGTVWQQREAHNDIV